MNDEFPRIDTTAIKDLHAEVRKLMVAANTPPWPHGAQPLLTSAMERVNEAARKKRVAEARAEVEVMLRARAKARAERLAIKAKADGRLS